MNDLINGCFELGGAIMLLRNCLLLYRHKTVRGVSIATVAFFAFWGCWNVYYYPSLGQTLSFAAGCAVVFANILWCAMALWYGHVFRVNDFDLDDLHL